jgi:hypothetical protein
VFTFYGVALSHNAINCYSCSTISDSLQPCFNGTNSCDFVYCITAKNSYKYFWVLSCKLSVGPVHVANGYNKLSCVFL